jgi:hypothetical protein
MSIADEIYMNHHVSEFHKLDKGTAKLWKEGQDRWCFRRYGITVDEFRKKKENEMSKLDKFEGTTKDDYDGSRGYGSSGGRDPISEERLANYGTDQDEDFIKSHTEDAPVKKTLPHAYGDTLPKQYEMPGQHVDEVPCSDHPNAPHGFNRNASHGNNRYTCECEGWEEEMVDDIIESLEHLKERYNILTGHDDEYYDEQISYMKGLK